MEKKIKYAIYENNKRRGNRKKTIQTLSLRT